VQKVHSKCYDIDSVLDGGLTDIHHIGHTRDNGPITCVEKLCACDNDD
jgi:hypothetical protein